MSLVSEQNVIEDQSPTGNHEMQARTFDGRIVLIHKMALNELDGQSRLADTCPRTHDTLDPLHSSLSNQD